MDFISLPLGLDLDSNTSNNDDNQVNSDQLASSVLPKSTAMTTRMTMRKDPSRTDLLPGNKKTIVKTDSNEDNNDEDDDDDCEEDGESNYMDTGESLTTSHNSPRKYANHKTARAGRSRTPSSSSRRSRNKRDHVTKKTSIRLFREFIRRGSDGKLDASKIHSRECYEAWLASRKGPSNEPEKSFQRALSSHLTAVDGRVPFTAEEEAAILQVLRRKERWPCFAHCAIRFGHTGFRALGYHERCQLEGKGDASDLATLRRERKNQLKTLEGEDDDDNDYASPTAPARRKNKKRSKVSAESDNTSYDDYEEEGDNSTSIAQEIMNGLIDDESPRVSVQNAGRTAPSNSSSSSSLAITTTATTIQMDFYQTNAGDMFIGMAQSLFGGLASVGIEAWKKLLTFGRMLLMRTGWFKRPTMEDAQRLMQAITVRHPHDGILLLDFLCPDFADRFILQNDISRRYIGAVGRMDGGFSERIFPSEDVWNVLHASIAAFRGRGVREIPIRFGLICLGNVVVPFDGHVYVDPPTGLFVFRGRPAPPAPSPSSLLMQ